MAEVSTNNITPCLWFDTEAEDAAKLYTSLFKNSRITSVVPYGEAGPRPAGMTMMVQFELEGRDYVGLNGGPDHPFTDAISFHVSTSSPEETDFFWNSLRDGGEEGPCGWLKDRFGLSWQIVPTRMVELVTDPDPVRSQAAVTAMMQMSKIEIGEIEEAVARATN